MGLIADKLVPRLRQRFPDRVVTFGSAPSPCAVFGAAHPDFGDVQIFDDGSDVTLVAGNFTHGHFSDYQSTVPEAAAENIVNDVIDFLDRLFADRIVFWGSHRGGGGWHSRGESDSDFPIHRTGQLYVWSGPITGG